MRRVLFAVFFAGLLAACGTDSTTPAPVAEAPDLPADNIIHGLSHVMTKAGVRTGVLESDTAYLYEVGRRLDLRVVRLQFFNEVGVQTGTLTSKTGEYDITTGAFIARGDVVLVTESPDGQRRLETEELHYDVQGDRLWSEKPFVLNQNGRVTRGSSFRSDSRFQSWSVTNAQTEGGIPQSGSGIQF